jgi:hypothetical protein
MEFNDIILSRAEYNHKKMTVHIPIDVLFINQPATALGSPILRKPGGPSVDMVGDFG